MLEALIGVPAGIGYPLLFGFVAAESAGALVPGETSLIVAAALASQGQLSLPLVIAVAAGGAILCDNVGYLIGRRGLRRLVDRPGRWAAGRRRLVERGEVFFARHGSAAVFFGRWLPGTRVVASWLAGAERMPWPRFLLWNTLGGIAWATTVGTLAYVLGQSASSSLGAIGFVGVAVAVVVYLIARLRRGHALPGSRYVRIPVNWGRRWLLAVKTRTCSHEMLTPSQRHRPERTSLWTRISFGSCTFGARCGRRNRRPT
jgi:membrane protein DedA with SNARE-associated domain